MGALQTIGPQRVREILKQNSTTLILPYETLVNETAGDAYVVPFGSEAIPAGIRLPGGEAGLARVVGSALAGRGVYGEASGASDRNGGCYRVTIPAEVVGWCADRTFLWGMLAGVPAAGTVEVAVVSSEDLAETLLSPEETVWHCRIGDAGWIVIESGDDKHRDLARGLQRVRDLLRRLGVRGAEIKTERRPPSRVSEGTRLLRLATADWVAYWPVSALNRLLGEILDASSSGVRSREIDVITLQRAVSLRVCDRLLHGGGIGGIVTALPRTAEERRGRYAVRTVRELLRAGGVVPRVLAETAYRSGTHYRALAVLVEGMPVGDRETLRRALGRTRWEQVLDHSERGVVDRLPWIAFTAACETLVRDLAERSRRPGYSPPAAVIEIVRREYTDPRDAKLYDAWKKQIDSGALARALEEARLSFLRPLLRRLPRDLLVRAGCGDTRETKMRLSASFSRRGRLMYLEDVAVLEGRVRRREMQEWDLLLTARMATRAVAERARSRGNGSTRVPAR